MLNVLSLITAGASAVAIYQALEVWGFLPGWAFALTGAWVIWNSLLDEWRRQ